MILFVITIFIVFVYSVLLYYYRHWWNEMELFSAVDKHDQELPFVSVIVPARNEETTIGDLLYSLSKQQYSGDLFEVIVVDDHSDDNTVEVVKTFLPKIKNLRVIKLADYLDGQTINSYKKKAIEIAVSVARGSVIMNTDADCIVPSGWIRTVISFYRDKDAAMIVAPVKMEVPVCKDIRCRLLYALQILDFSTMQGITGAALWRHFHYMANGANMTYRKSAFEAVGGYTDVDRLASGDDMFLLEKIRMEQPDKIHYLKSAAATVSTYPEPTLSSFINQRIRWASKSAAYKDWKIKVVLSLVYIANLWSVVLFFAGICGGYWWLWCGYVLVKMFFEYLLLRTITGFFDQKSLLQWFLPVKPFHCTYLVLSGFLGMVGSYKWKGRAVS